ncbi:MAG TPA: tyrosine recombinase XerC [Papillibacter sp.]|nr:tyrosine recombinase XerC [Papillibacter sp.]
MDTRDNAPEILREFLVYHETIKGHSKKTVDEYYLDLRTFFRYIKMARGLVPKGTDFEDIHIQDVDLPFVGSITLTDVYDFLSYLSRQRPAGSGQVGLSPTSRARKIATLRSFYKYLTVKAKKLEKNPVADLDSPKVKKTLPRYLSLDESRSLLASVEGKHKARDLCILTLFLNCGLRISELVDLNISDVRGDTLRIRGKGGKEREVFLNDACLNAIKAYMEVREAIQAADKSALFLSARRTRITRATVHNLVKKHIANAGLDADRYSAHKLRHTAATLMLRGGVDVRTLQELLGHEHLNTTQIYTHVESESLRRAARLNPLSDFDPEE